MEAINIEEKYNELIQHILCLGKTILLRDRMSLTIRLLDNSTEEPLKVTISIPMNNDEYDYTQVNVSWRIPSKMEAFKTLKFPVSASQKMMFDTLLFDITNWKLDYLINK